jgi:hypothetical protein
MQQPQHDGHKYREASRNVDIDVQPDASVSHTERDIRATECPVWILEYSIGVAKCHGSWKAGEVACNVGSEYEDYQDVIDGQRNQLGCRGEIGSEEWVVRVWSSIRC